MYDISAGFFNVRSYEDDPEAQKDLINRMELGDGCNLSTVFASTHHATHVDAPRHFIENGATVDQMPLNVFYGACTVVEVPEGMLTGTDAERIVEMTEKRLLLKGNGKVCLSQSAAFVLADSGIVLVGTDAQSIDSQGKTDAHVELLSNNIPIIEGLELKGVESGDYILSAFPIKFNGLESAFVRAVLLDPFYRRINY